MAGSGPTLMVLGLLGWLRFRRCAGATAFRSCCSATTLRATRLRQPGRTRHPLAGAGGSGATVWGGAWWMALQWKTWRLFLGLATHDAVDRHSRHVVRQWDTPVHQQNRQVLYWRALSPALLLNHVLQPALQRMRRASRVASVLKPPAEGLERVWPLLGASVQSPCARLQDHIQQHDFLVGPPFKAFPGRFPAWL